MLSPSAHWLGYHTIRLCHLTLNTPSFRRCAAGRLAEPARGRHIEVGLGARSWRRLPHALTLHALLLAALRLFTQRIKPLHFGMKLLRKDRHARLALGWQVRDHLFQYASHLGDPSSFSSPGMTEPAREERHALSEKVMPLELFSRKCRGPSGLQFEDHQRPEARATPLKEKSNARVATNKASMLETGGDSACQCRERARFDELTWAPSRSAR